MSIALENYLHKTKEVKTSSRRILYFINSFPGYHFKGGGTQTQLRLLLRAQTQTYGGGYDKTVMVNNSADRGSPKVNHIDPSTTTKGGLVMPQNLMDLIKEVKNSDVLFMFDGMLILYPLQLATLFATAGNKPVIKRIVTKSEIEGIKKLFHTPFKRYLDRIDSYVSQSQELTELAVKAGIPPDKITQIDNAVDTEFFKPASSDEERNKIRQKIFPGMGPDKLIFVTHGRLSDKNKRIEEILQAWVKGQFGEDGHKLLLIGPLKGPGPNREGERLIKEYGGVLGRESKGILWTGYIRPEEVLEPLQGSDVYIGGGVNEGFSNSALEAAATGNVCILKKGIPGNNRIINNGQTGILFDSDSPTENLLSSMKSAQNSPFRSDLAKKSLEYVRGNFGPASSANTYDSLFNRLLTR